MATPGASARRLDPAARLTVDSSADAFEFLISKDETPGTQNAAPAAPTADEAAARARDAAAAKAAEEAHAAAAQAQQDADAADDATSDTDADDEPVPASPRTLRLPDGQEITEDEAIHGYLRQSDYTRKRQADAEKARADEAERVAVKLEREHYAKYLTELQQALATQTPAEPNWVERQKMLAPEQYIAEHAAWQEHQKNVRIVEQRAAEARAKVAADQRKEMDAYLASEAAKVLEKIPAWKDPAVADAERRELVKYATETYGWTEKEIESVYDHRSILALRRAYQADKAEARKPAVQAAVQQIKTATPGSTNPARRQVTEIERKNNRLKKTGHWRDAGDLIAEIIE